MNHTVEERRGLVLQTDTHTDATRHLGTPAYLPLLAKGLFIVLAEHELIRFFLDEMGHSALIHEAYGDHIIALTEQSFGYLIATRRILVARVTHQFTINISIVAIVEGAKEQLGFLSSMTGINMDMLAQPQRTDPFTLGQQRGILVHLRPLGVIIIREGVFADTGIVGIQYLLPLLFGLTGCFLLGIDKVIILIKLHLLVIQGEMLCQCVGGDPGFNRRTAPGTFNDTLCHALLTLQLFAKEIADRGKAPCILPIQFLPGRGAQVGTRSVRIRLILHME